MSLSLLAVVTGHLAAMEADALALADALARAAAADPSLQVVLVVDGPDWLKTLPLRSRALTVVTAPPEMRDRPAALFTLALGRAIAERVAFAWPGVEVDVALPAIRRLAARAAADDLPFIASAPGPSETRRLPPHSWLAAPVDGLPPAYPVGWLQLADLAPMHQAVVETELLRRLGFSDDPRLQAGFWWDFCLRAAREGELTCDPTPAAAASSWWRHPFRQPSFGAGDDSARLIMDRQSVAPPLAPAPSAAGTAQLPAASLEAGALAAPWARKLRVTVLGGVNEPAHNQLCFFNYFERLRELGWLSWRTVLDTAAHDLDVLRSDLVIFSRVKTDAGRRLMELCVRQGVPTLYMIDDNWLRVGADVPAYREIFAPDAPFTRVFLHGLDRADLTLVYNPILAEDVRPHAREVAQIETNIDLTLFPSTAGAREGRERLTLGYVGSVRTDTIALDALVDVVMERPNTDLFFMSGHVPEGVRRVPEERLTIAPYVFDYARYARMVCEAAPDILLAPLGDTLFEQSKCPNKYLEITAAGACGVYSDVGLYRRYVRDGDNGYLAPAHTRKAWRAAIERAIDAGAERRAVAARAHADVAANFATERRLPDLIGVLARTLELAAARHGARRAA